MLGKRGLLQTGRGNVPGNDDENEGLDIRENRRWVRVESIVAPTHEARRGLHAMVGAH